MRITHIITGLNDGGAEAVLYRLCTTDHTHQHTVISLMDAGKYGPMLEAAGVNVHCLRMPRGRVTLHGLFRLWRLLRANRPDVVQTWMYHSDLVGGVVARLAGIRRVCWGIHHTTLEPGKSARSTIWVARINAMLSRWVPKVIICCAEKARDVHEALGYVSHKMVVIPNGYNLSQFCPAKEARELLRRTLSIDSDTFLVGMVGRFDPQKDHANLIKALSILKRKGYPFVCLLVGKSLVLENDAIAKQIAANGLGEHVRLLGQRTDIPGVMNALDVHVLSSYGEAFPNVLPEAMACGTPCVTTHVGDAALIVGDTGWVVPARDPEALADALLSAYREILDQPLKWALRKVAARDRVAAHFSIEQMVESYHRVWRASNET